MPAKPAPTKSGPAKPAPERPACQFYVGLLDITDLSVAAVQLDAAIEQHKPAAVLLGFASDDPVVIGDGVTALQAKIQGQDIACILLGDPKLAHALECDGVHMAFTDMPVKQARAALGDDYILGIACGTSRHDAMIAAEQSADYVAFGPYDSTATADDLDALKWWQDMMEMPCIAMTGDAAQAENLYQAGADFVLIHKTS